MEAIRIRSQDPYVFQVEEYYKKAEADAEIARLEMKLRAICPHKKFYEISFEDGYPGGDIATYECEYCGYHFTGELPQ